MKRNCWKMLLLLLPVAALILELLPYGVAMWFGRQTDDGSVVLIRETYSYFSMMPFGYAMFTPMITGIMTIAVLILAIIRCCTKKMGTRSVQWTACAAACASCVHFLMGVRYITVAGAVVTLCLISQCILARYLSKQK